MVHGLLLFQKKTSSAVTKSHLISFTVITDNPYPLELSLEIPPVELATRCRQGDAIGYRLLYEQCAGSLYNTALRLLQNETGAREALSSCFIQAIDAMHQLPRRTNIDNWLKKLLVLHCIEMLKRGKKNWAEIDTRDIEGYALRDDPETEDPEVAFTTQGIQKGIGILPTGYRTVVSLHLVEAYSCEEIALMLGIAPETVCIQYKRARKKLLQIMLQNNLHA
jgi:RNA polymerase sigma factor (sigma-70 family)